MEKPPVAANRGADNVHMRPAPPVGNGAQLSNMLSGAPQSAPSGDQPMLSLINEPQFRSLGNGHSDTPLKNSLPHPREEVEEDAPSTPEYDAPEITSQGRRTRARRVRDTETPDIDDEDRALLDAEIIPTKPSKVEANLIDKIVKQVQREKKENWSYHPAAATKSLQEIERLAQPAPLAPEDEAEQKEIDEAKALLRDQPDLGSEATVEQRFFVRPACSLRIPSTDDQEDMLVFLERGELRSREFLVQLDHEKTFPWLVEMMAFSSSEFLAIRAFQALQYLLFNFEDEAYVHGPCSGGYLPCRKDSTPYHLSEHYGTFLSFFYLESILNAYGAELEESASQVQQRSSGQPPAVFVPAHNLSLVIRFVSVAVLATPCAFSVAMRTDFFVLFCRLLLDPLMAIAINCTAGIESTLAAICTSFSPEEWQRLAPELARVAMGSVQSHMLLRNLLRHFPGGGRILELRTRICCLFLQPNEPDPQVPQVIISTLERIVSELTDDPPRDPSLLVTQTLCIDFLTDTLIRQIDTQAENVHRVKILVNTFNTKLRDKMHLTISALKNTLIEFSNRLDLYLRLLQPKQLVQQKLPFGKKPDEEMEDCDAPMES